MGLAGEPVDKTVMMNADPTCARCQGSTWICEAHPVRPWPHDDCSGPGEPCPACNASEPRSHLRFASSALTLAEIEVRLRDDGWDQENIDTTLAFITLVRERLAEEGKWPPKRESLNPR